MNDLFANKPRHVKRAIVFLIAAAVLFLFSAIYGFNQDSVVMRVTSNIYFVAFIIMQALSAAESIGGDK